VGLAEAQGFRTQLAGSSKQPGESALADRLPELSTTIENDDQSTGQAGTSGPPGALRSESENNSSGWLRRMRPSVGVKGAEAKIGILVNIAAVLSAYSEAFG
jgi:hypothetical protein